MAKVDTTGSKLDDTDDDPDTSGHNVLSNAATVHLDFSERSTPSFGPVTQNVIDGTIAWGADLPHDYFKSFWAALSFDSPSGKDPLFSISLQDDPTTAPPPVLVLVYGCGVYTQP